MFSSPKALCDHVREAYGLDADGFPDSVQSRFDQKIALKDLNGSWKKELYIAHIGYTETKLKWGSIFCKDPLIEWAFRMWSIERIERRMELRSIALLSHRLGELKDYTKRRGEFQDEFFEWSLKVATDASADKDAAAINGIKLFYCWCVEEELPGFDEFHLDQLERVTYSVRHSTLVPMLDPIGGPHISLELRRIEAALSANPEWVQDRAIYYLCRDWGLRPVQLALLRESDIGEDDVGPYIMVPSVKGTKRSALRRHPTNFRKRYISAECVDALNCQISLNKETIRTLTENLINSGGCPANLAKALPRPLFPGEKSHKRVLRYASDKATIPYILHSDAQHLSRRFRSLTQILSIPMHSSRVESGVSHQIMQLGIYRLRRTKGTSMVLNGATLDEVAEALDHLDVASVAHYFKFNRELIDFINASTYLSPEIIEATEMWSGRMTSSSTSPEQGDWVVQNLGICKLAAPCPLHPTVSCYGCTKFRPFVEGNHEKARDDILRMKENIDSKSTGPLRSQMDEALAHAESIIKVIRNG